MIFIVLLSNNFFIKNMNKKLKIIISSILVGIGGLTFFKFYNKDNSKVAENNLENLVEVKKFEEDNFNNVVNDSEFENVNSSKVNENVVELADNVAEVKEASEEKMSEKTVAKVKELKVDQKKCVGCGRCVKTASSNFAMSSSKKSIVISQENLNSDSVQKAIEKCPVGAISIS